MAYRLLSDMPNDIKLAYDFKTESLARWNGKDFIPIGGNGGGKVSAVRSGEVYSGIQLHCVSYDNAIFSYFTGEVVTANEIEIPAGEQFAFATADDFPELALYQGSPLIETGHVITIDMQAGTITDNTVLVFVSSDIGITNLSTEPLIIPANTLFTFNKILVLGSPAE